MKHKGILYLQGQEVMTKEETMLSQLMHECASEIVTDEQVDRVLAPVLARIEAGEFSKTKPLRKKRRITALSSVALLALIVTATLILALQPQTLAQPSSGYAIEIQDPSIPLAATPTELAAAVKAEEITLENGQTDEIIKVTGEIIPDGTWRLMATLDGQRIEIGWLTLENGTTRLIE